jgi:hypothetical protein
VGDEETLPRAGMITCDVFSTVLDEKTNLPRVLINVQRWTGHAIFDTGATQSVISSRILNRIGYFGDKNIKSSNHRVRLAVHGLTVDTTQIVTLPVVLAG